MTKLLKHSLTAAITLFGILPIMGSQNQTVQTGDSEPGVSITEDPLFSDQEFLSEGKEWDICHFHDNPHYPRAGFSNDVNIHVSIIGEEVVEGKTCKVLKLNHKKSGECGWCMGWCIPPLVYAYEEDGALYVYRLTKKTPWIMDERGYHPEWGVNFSFQEVVNTVNGLEEDHRYWYIPFRHLDSVLRWNGMRV